MPLTIGLTGMDPATESALRDAFTEANSRLGGRWTLRPENDADFVVVDMDSMYGPMSWLRLHSAGRSVVGLTSSPRSQTEFRLARPFDVGNLVALLQQLDGSAGEAPPAEPAPAETVSAAAVETAVETTIAPAAASPAGMTPAPQPQDRLPEEVLQAVSEESADPVEAAEAIAVDELTPAAAHEPPSAAAGLIVPPAPSIQPQVPAEPRTLADWLASGRLTGRVRFERDGTTVLIDTDQRQYFGPATLKSIAGHYAGTLSATDFHPVDAGTWASESAAMGAAQPLARLVWFGALLAGQGKLAPGFDPAARFQLLKWPQTEREFPKHFRIATAMMKGPATLAEIAEGSGVPLVDVTDFVNANLATGFAEPYREPEPEPETQKSAGLFGRLRGR